MARPSYGYRNAAGKRVPGVTTLLELVNMKGSNDFLLQWACKLAREGKDWKQERDRAGAHGTMLHEMCENYLEQGREGDPPKPEACGSEEQYQNLLKSYRAIAAWWAREKPEVVMAEEPLVSEQLQYGGTLDGLMKWKGQLWLFDFKTGSQVGAKEVCQMAAYRQLLDECKKQRPHGAVLIHAPTKEPGYMRPIVCEEKDLDAGWDVFGYALAVHRILPVLKEVCE